MSVSVVSSLTEAPMITRLHRAAFCIQKFGQKGQRWVLGCLRVVGPSVISTFPVFSCSI